MPAQPHFEIAPAKLLQKNMATDFLSVSCHFGEVQINFRGSQPFSRKSENGSWKSMENFDEVILISPVKKSSERQCIPQLLVQLFVLVLPHIIIVIKICS